MKRPWSRRYHMLVASLPPLPPHLQIMRLPITAERLDDRLRLLEPDDAAEIARLHEVMRWSRQFEESTDEAVVRRYHELWAGIANPLVRDILTVLMDVRMITTALRRRRLGLGPPPCGIGRWFDHVRRNFNRPDFGLGRVLPRLSRLAPLLEQGDVLGLQRGLLQATWALLKQRADDYTFRFEAVVLYVARWSLLAQWQLLDAERGRPIFEALVTEALGEHAHVHG
jgi:hypothetical protein